VQTRTTTLSGFFHPSLAPCKFFQAAKILPCKHDSNRINIVIRFYMASQSKTNRAVRPGPDARPLSEILVWWSWGLD